MKKFESSLNFSKEKVKNILFDKINEEKTNIEKKKTKENIEKDEELISKANKLYDPHKINIVSLFSGAGGLDLGILFAGISVSKSVDDLYNNW
ncbi:DNA cytosine methyltransferase, partial [Limosilactobacillus reuteri]